MPFHQHSAERKKKASSSKMSREDEFMLQAPIAISQPTFIVATNELQWDAMEGKKYLKMQNDIDDYRVAFKIKTNNFNAYRYRNEESLFCNRKLH